MQFLPARNRGAPWKARHLFAKKILQVSAGNLWVEIAWMQFLPAFQGSGFRLHCLRQPACGGPFQSGLGWWARTLQKQYGLFFY
jgi:hypothetical protein